MKADKFNLAKVFSWSTLGKEQIATDFLHGSKRCVHIYIYIDIFYNIIDTYT